MRKVNILTPEFGPRLYLTGILTELELEADRRMEEQVCIGESCSRCLHSCPPDAVKQWGLDKAGCATEAQEFGYMTITSFMSRFLDMSAEEQKAALHRIAVCGELSDAALRFHAVTRHRRASGVAFHCSGQRGKARGRQSNARDGALAKSFREAV